jgi:hypothetical protein
VIPSAIVLGLALGRWWKTTLVLVAIAWPIALVADGTFPEGGTWTWADVGRLFGSALLALVNAGVGIVAHQTLLWLVRGVRYLVHHLGGRRSSRA